MTVVIGVKGIAQKGDLRSEEIIMKDIEEAMRTMDRFGLTSEFAQLLPASLQKILLVPQFIEVGEEVRNSSREMDAPWQESKAMLVEIEVNIPYAKELSQKLRKIIEKALESVIKGKAYVGGVSSGRLSVRINHYGLYRAIKLQHDDRHKIMEVKT